VKREPFRAGEYGPHVSALQGLFFRMVFEVEPQSFSTLLALLPDCPASAVIGDAALIPVIAKIQRWGRDWHLIDAWCVSGALALLLTLSHYGHSAAHTLDTGAAAIAAPLVAGDLPELDKLLAAMAKMGDLPIFLISMTLPPAPASFAFEHAGWDVGLSTRRAFESETRTAFETALRQYCDGMETRAQAHGFDKSREQRSLEHYRWLARFQVNGESPAAIWRSLPARDNRTRRAVEKAIRDTARRIGLTLR
jgi:hypothetical protein